MMNTMRMVAVTNGWTHQRSCRSVGSSGPPRVPPSTTLVELSTAATHSPCYRPTFECLANLRQRCDHLLLRERPFWRPCARANPPHLANRYRGSLRHMGGTPLVAIEVRESESRCWSGST